MFGNGGGALAVTLDERVAFVCFLALEPCDCLGNGAPADGFGCRPNRMLPKAVDRGFTRAELPADRRINRPLLGRSIVEKSSPSRIAEPFVRFPI